MPHTVTLQDLDDLGACLDQQELFDNTFPDGITIAVDNAEAVALAVVEAGLDVGWYADHALTDDEGVAYLAATAEARAAFDAAMAEARAARKVAADAARVDYDAVVTLTRAHAAEAAAWAVYRAVEAEVLCSILARRGA